MKSFKFFLILLSCTILALNSAKGQEADPAITEKIKQTLAKNLATTPAADRTFIYNAVDLNDDGKDEYLVGLTGSTFCGSAGCTMLVLNNKFGVNTRMTLVRYPVYVGYPASKEVTKGYSNIYVDTKGVGLVKLSWTGAKYPTNPSTAPKIAESVISGKFAFLDEKSLTKFSF